MSDGRRYGFDDSDRRDCSFLHDSLVLSSTKEMLATGQAGDLSLKMFLTLAAGVAMGVYGALKADFVIIIANAVSLALLLGILYFKVREPHSASKHA